mmetsp:Transcript_58274/g.62950  ORF Transcript_58274/g.62950 Transcript_58274/m.62950 type:complete len:92 (+) Transcript_58274:49-324(+)
MMMSFREMKKNDLDEFLEKNDLFCEKKDAKNSFCCKFQISRINATNNNTLVITAKKAVFDIIKRNLLRQRRMIRIMKADAVIYSSISVDII